MLSNQSYARIDTLELKTLIIKKIGQRADKYFDQLTRLFSFKITKSEFDKFCIKIIGRENIPLHNLLIRSIIKNAYLAKVPPSKGIKRVGSSLNVKTANGCQRNCLQSLYGDAFPPSPRKGRSPVNRDRKFRDRPSPLGPLGKPQSVVCEELNSRAQEQQSATELLSLGGARKTLSNVSICGSHLQETCLHTGELPDTRSLRSRLEQKLEMEGISVSVDCVNLLNNGLDMYLKRLIEPCMGLASSRCGTDHLKEVNGSSHLVQMGCYLGYAKTEGICLCIHVGFSSCNGVKSPNTGGRLGTLLEKISLHTSEE
ncbi:hypothetical protein GH714_012655 [Hevea brasiliensis]|uniref:Transcriptional coactivator Hfi1/Transcriptional adapter 1 n=1 Tax=Hevea brasiliensis TaxID=3981 RepID=A0A6A6L1G8_HEVBR|nr:hypothetical protein GH714_012655 [Hevea brasiliensis]